MMNYMWNYLGGYGGGYGYGMMGGGFGFFTMLLVWTVLILIIALLWQKINNK